MSFAPPDLPPDLSSFVALLRARARHEGPTPRGFAWLLETEAAAGPLALGFADLDRNARAVAARLQQAGLAGERVLLLYPPGLDFLPAFFGCLYAGAVAVPAYPPRANRPNPNLRSIAADCAPRAILTTRAILADAPRWGDAIDGFANLERLASDEIESSEAGDWAEFQPGPDQLAFLQYTSGSTAAPKGVRVTHRNLMANSAAIRQAFGATVESRGVFWLPLYHDMGLIGGVLQTIYCGGSSTLFSPVAFLQRPLRWLEAISTTGATISGGPDFAYDLCARKITEDQKAKLDLSRWSVAFNGAEPIRPATLDRFAQAFASCGFRREAFLPCYGLAEATLMVAAGRETTLDVDATALEAGEIAERDGSSKPRRLVGSGRVADGHRVVISDPATLAELPGNRVGEIWVEGPSVASGYWNAEAETTFQANLGSSEGSILRTGDLGFIAGGSLYVVGRLKDLVVIRGRNVHPQDVEATVAASHGSLRPDGGAAFSVEVEGEERLVVVHELERRGSAGDEVLTAIRQAVALEHGIELHAIALIRPMTLPRTSSGKPRRGETRRAFLEGTLEPVATWTAGIERARASDPEPSSSRSAGEIAGWLAAKLAGPLGSRPEEVDRRRPFAEFGLGSLRAVELAGELEAWLGRSLAPTLLYDHPTIAALAAHLAGESPTEGRPAADRPVDDQRVAIVGVGCRFPGASGPEAFWNLLANGVDAVGPVPGSRRNELGELPGLRGGFLDAVDGFDADFFGIAPREATEVDPQQRLLLEVAWEAFEDAGIVPDRLAGAKVGVFVGVSTGDYGRLIQSRGGDHSAHALTGNASSVAANRISYAFDFRGPSLAVDTACSSSLVAVHLACQSLASGESDLALAGGVNLILAPEMLAAFEQAGFLAPDATCKAFDARADGYVRGEGAGLVLLKPLARALADGDPIHAVIRGSAINQDGRSNGLTAPSAQAQERVLRDACRAAGVSPGQVGYVEAHGTGTLLGDPIEASALGSVLVEGRNGSGKCRVGSVKTNIGHLEAAAGVAGLIKAALMLERKAIPPSLHFATPNPSIPFDRLPIAVSTSLDPWPADHPRLAGVSSFGFGGTNAHVVLEGFDWVPAEVGSVTLDSSLVTLSARSPEALRALATAYAGCLASGTSLVDLAFTTARHRSEHDHRAAFVARSNAEAIGLLGALAAGEPGPYVGRRLSGRSPRIGLILGDAVPLERVRELVNGEPVILAAFEEVERLAGSALVAGLADLRWLDPASVRLATLATGVGIARLWRNWGVEFETVAGRGIGAVAADQVSGRLTLAEAVRIAKEGVERDSKGVEPGVDAFVTVGTGIGEVPGRVIDALGSADSARSAVLNALGELHALGAAVDLAAAVRDGQRVALPTYPWQRRRFWAIPERTRTAAIAVPEEVADGDGLLYETRWEGLEPTGSTARVSGTWLIVEGASGLGRELATILEARGAAARVISGDPDLLIREGEEPLAGVLDLRGLDLPGIDTLAAGTLESASLAASTAVIDLAERLSSHPGARLWVVTRCAMAVEATDRVEPLATLLWGLGQSLALEHPGGWGGMVDLDTSVTSRDLESLVDSLLQSDGETQVAIRDGRRLVARLTPVEPSSRPAIDLTPRAEATYLITGGLGALGLASARWLVDRGARRLILVGRTGLPPRNEWHGAAVDRRVSAIQELERLGATVVVEGADVADPRALQGVLERTSRFLPPIRGVIHAAGVVEGAEASLAESLRAKVVGTWTLSRVIDAASLDFFLLYSSVAGVLGAKGSAGYAAANRFLDGFAEAAGAPALSVAWGPWAGEGMASDRRATHRRLGFEPLEPARAFAALERAAASGARAVAVLDADWATLRGVSGDSGLTRFLGRMEGGTGITKPRPAPIRIEGATVEARRDAVLAYVLDKVAGVLELEPGRVDPERPLDGLGLDSLMAIELKSAVEADLGRSLPLTALMEGPTIRQLADRLLAEWADGASAEASAEPSMPLDSPHPTSDHPLTAGQEALWHLQRRMPGDPAYNMAGAARVRARVDAPALRRSIQALVDRHASLRTTFPEVDGRPVQRVARSQAAWFRVEDASSWPEADLTRRLAAEARRPFDLERGPLFRTWLFSRGPDDHYLVLSAHHLVGDFWSIAVLMHELGLIYPSGSAASLPSPGIEFVDFARAQRERLEGPEGTRLRAYWAEALAGPLPTLALATDRPRPPVRTHRGVTRSIRIDAGLVRSLSRLGSSRGASLYVTLLAALHVLLGRLAGQDDVIIGSPVAGRDRANTTGVVGYFTNPLPIRASLAGDPSFEDFLAQVKRAVFDGLEHQGLPLATMVEAFAPARDASRSPIFSSLFAYQKAQRLGAEGLAPFALRKAGPRLELGGLPLESVALDLRTSQFDLTFSAAESGDGLTVALEAAADLFDPGTATRIVERYRALLESIAARPSQRVSELELLPVKERVRVLSRWNRTEADFARESTIHALIERQGATTPEAIAVVCGSRKLTYVELNTRANRLARRLRELGIGPESTVGLELDRSVDLVVGVLATLKAGGAYVPLDPDYPAERRALLADDAGIAAVVGRGGSSGAGRPVVSVEDPTLEHLDPRNLPPLAGPGNLAYVIHTSGSTGRPKGVSVAHRNLVASTQARSLFYRDPVSAFLLSSSLAFDSSVAGLFWTLTTGGTLVIPEPGTQADPVRLASLIATQRVSHWLSVPSLVNLVLDEADPAALEPLRALIVAGEPCPRDLPARVAERLPGVTLVNEYGPTEATVWSTASVCRGDDRTRPVPIGRPIAGARAYVLDDRLRPAPIGVPGELFLGGEGVARGYLGRPGLTADRFLPDPFASQPGSRLYRSGDLARWRSDGQLEFLGRVDQQVKIRGIRVEPGEVETALRTHEAVREAVVIARSDTQGNPRLVAYVVPVAGSTAWPGPAELRRWLRQSLPEGLVPSAFVRLEDLPRTPNGKVDPNALPEPEFETGSVEAVAPRTEAERVLAEVTAGVLGVGPVGVEDDLFDRGIDSIRAIQLASRARQQGWEFDPARVFDHPSVAELATLARPVGTAATLEASAALEDSYPATPMQRAMLLHSALEPGSGVYVQQFTCSITGPLDLDAFAAAWRWVVARHPALRTGFEGVGSGEPRQVVQHSAPLSITTLDWSRVRDVETELESLLALERARGFDPAEPPLLRLSLASASDRLHHLVVTSHHAIMDGWCAPIVLGEVLTAYEAINAQQEPALPPVRPYGDFVRWLATVDLADAERFWRGELAGLRQATPLAIPAPPRLPEAPRHERSTRLTAAATEALGRMARGRRLTLGTVAQGAWAVVLGRYAAVDEVTLGVAVSGRPAGFAGVEGMVGLFLNTLPSRVRLPMEEPASRWLGALQARMVEARRHELAPLVEIQGWSEVPRGRPLFESVFVFENYPDDPEARALAERLGVGPIRVLERTSYPLALTVLPGDELVLSIDCDARRFDAGAIERLLEQLVHVIEQITQHPEIPLADLTLEPGEAISPREFDPGSAIPWRGRNGAGNHLLAELARLSDAEVDTLLADLATEAEAPSP
jgi:amino acid adenylation domain-containing protein